MRLDFTAKILAVSLCLLTAGVASAEVANVYWRVDLNQGTSVIAYGQGTTEQAAWDDCRRLRAITRAMTSTETRKSAVSAVTTSVVRWCKNPMELATVRPNAPVDCAVSSWSAWSAGSWSTCSGGSQSRTETRSRTITTQPADGGLACPALTETRTVSQTCSTTPSGTASLQWIPPTQNSDGTVLTNLAGYRISYGTSPTALVSTIQLANASATSYTLGNLSPGTYYFAVRAYTTGGTESANSNIGSKVVQ